MHCYYWQKDSKFEYVDISFTSQKSNFWKIKITLKLIIKFTKMQILNLKILRKQISETNIMNKSKQNKTNNNSTLCSWNISLYSASVTQSWRQRANEYIRILSLVASMAQSAYRKNARNKLHSTRQAEVVSREKHDEDQDLSTLSRKCEEQVKKQGEGRSESKR